MKRGRVVLIGAPGSPTTRWGVMSILKTALTAVYLLGPGIAQAAPVFFTCTGTQTEFSSDPPPSGYRPGDRISDEKKTEAKEITLTMMIDPDAGRFGWTLRGGPVATRSLLPASL